MDGGIQAAQGQDSAEKGGWRLQGGREGGRTAGGVEKQRDAHTHGDVSILSLRYPGVSAAALGCGERFSPRRGAPAVGPRAQHPVSARGGPGVLTYGAGWLL